MLPLKEPTAVRAAPAITTSVIFGVLPSGGQASAADGRAEPHSRPRHAGGRARTFDLSPHLRTRPPPAHAAPGQCSITPLAAARPAPGQQQPPNPLPRTGTAAHPDVDARPQQTT